jgi:outer membrane protein
MVEDDEKARWQWPQKGLPYKVLTLAKLMAHGIRSTSVGMNLRICRQQSIPFQTLPSCLPFHDTGCDAVATHFQHTKMYLCTMKSLVSLTFALFLAVFGLLAQSAPVRQIQLEESLRLALANNAQVRKNKLDRQLLERKFKEARSAVLPNVNAGVNLDWYPVLPTQLLPGQLFGQADGTFVPTQFGRPWQLMGAVTVEQPLLNESARRSIPAANVTRGISDMLLEKSNEEVLYNTATIFYQTLQTEQLLRGVNANVDKLQALQGMAELQLANGYAIPTDVKRIRVARTNLETMRQNLLTAIGGLRQTLQFLCGIPYDEPLELIADIGTPAADSLRWQSLTLETETTTEHRLLMYQLEMTRIHYRSARAEAFPILDLYGAASAQAFRSDINFFEPDRRWYGMMAVGLKMKVPLYDGFRVHNKAWVFKLEEKKFQEDHRQFVSAKTLEFRMAQEQFKNALRALSTQNDNVTLAREITDKLLLQYKEGVASLTDLLNAQTALSEAETNYWQQVFGYKLAVLKLLKAAGRLEDLQQIK